MNNLSEQNDKQREKAEEIIQSFYHEDDSDKILQSLSGLGEDAQRNAGQSLEALKRPVKGMIDQPDNDLPENLHKLREHVSELEPTYLKKKKINKLLNKVLGRNEIEQYAKKYKTVESQVEVIVESLLTGRDKLQEDNLMLRELKDVAKERIVGLEDQMELGQTLMTMLDEEAAKNQWKENPLPIQKAQQKVVSRVKNMSQAVMVLRQSMASVDLIIENNEKLEEAIFNAVTMTKNIITVTASIQLALGNQQKVISAVQNVNEATESMLLRNAEMLKQNTEETIKTLEKPAIAIESFRKAYNDVFEAIDITEKSNARIIDSGKLFITEMEELNNEMKLKLDGSTVKQKELSEAADRL
ncbi:toxic anion resistance protein [Guptibacillus algicola]|uniref:toxic anion resistance protein n=1 Tax=Guptibacillus algicola TaxID=225844 RepID=UPI001CD28E36|nr:toxic anion resistance protein [Alkalihalobacillus algicola]MCA0988218.1 toxic anion resistance protein [Alkalihalobacillus algicola]